MTLTFAALNPDAPEDLDRLQRLLEAAPAYSLVAKGHLPLPTAALETFGELPPGRSAADKLVGGYWVGDELVGCVDVCRGYPESHIAYVGLLLFAEPFQRRGLGRQALQQLRSVASSWGCTVLRIAVLARNHGALRFWRREGFAEVLRKNVLGYLGEAIVMQSEEQRPVGPRGETC